MSEEQQDPCIGILDYGMGNLRSVHRAFLEVGADAEIVQHPQQMEDKVALVFPGQGAIVDTMRLLQESGWKDFIKDWIDAERPYFGICLGLQALFEFSEEGDTEGLGVLQGTVRRFDFSHDASIKIPHMGWNQVAFQAEEPVLLKGIHPQQDQFYFVHSYYAEPADEAVSWGITNYGGLDFCSAVRRGTLVATQFHPEKSQEKGLQLYRNFLTSLKTGCEL
ncbi:MAG: imidazole glycerol phosphate synthase subunit HisH [Puniceicoccaceae bacterium]